jgi:pimeloyl-ACP methyl ester carboxylesterase
MDTWFTVSGMRIHCLAVGVGTGAAGSTGAGEPPIIMVHGWAGAAADWAPLLRVLPAGRCAVAVDLPGSGQSDKPDAPYDIPWFLDFLRSFCTAAGAPSIILAGHSLGGLIAVHFTARFPAMVEKLILVDPYGMKGEKGKAEPLARLGPLVDAAFRLNRRTFIEREIRRNVLHRADPETLRAAVDSTASSILGREGARALARVTRRLVGRLHVDGLLPGIWQPTLLLWGEQDRLLPPRWAAAYAARLPRMTLKMIPDAGHMPMFERPLDVAEKIERFLDGS